MSIIARIKEEMNAGKEENEEYESDENEEDYTDQYQKATEIIDEKKYDDDEPRIKINLEEIEERSPEEEESCISSVILSKEAKSTPKYTNNILILRKLLKHKNILYYYLSKWRRLVNYISLTKSFKNLKKKQRVPSNEYKIGDAIMINGAIDYEKKDSETDQKTINSILQDPNNEKIIYNLKCFIVFNKSKKRVINKYLKLWRENVQKLIMKEKEIEKIEQKYKKESLNIFENIINDNNNDENSIFNENNFKGGTQRKELNVKKSEIKVNKEVRKSFRIGTVNNNIIIKFEDDDKANDNMNSEKKINEKNEKNEDNGGNISLNNDIVKEISPEKSKDNRNKGSDKKEKSKKKKELKPKKKKAKSKKISYNKLKKIIEKLDNSKLLKKYFKKWFNISKIISHSNDKKNNINSNIIQSKDIISEKSIKNNKSNKNIFENKKTKKNKNKDNKENSTKKEEKSQRKKKQNIMEDYNSTTGFDNGEKNYQYNANKEHLINNSLVPKSFKKNDALNQNKSYSPIQLQKFEQDDENSLSINKNDISNDNTVSRKKSYVIEEEPTQVRQRRYTNGESPEVQEHTVRMLRLHEPIKEIKDAENGSIGIRISGEFIEFGTEITRYPSEITETITETTRIISEDTPNKNKVYNEREEEVVFQGKTFKRIIKTVEEEPESSHSSNSREKLEPEKNYPSYNNSAIKKIGNKEINQRLNDLQNEYYKTYSDWKSLKKYRSQNAFNKTQNIKKNDLRDNEVNVIERKRSSKDLQNGLDISDFTKEDKAYDNREKGLSKKKIEFSTKTYKKTDIINRPSLESLNSNKSDKKLKDKNSDKKTKKAIKNYKKAFKILRRMLKNRKKRNKDSFDQEKKLIASHYFMIWANETFPDGLDLYRQEKNSKNNNLNEEKINKNNNALGNNIINNTNNNRRKNEIITEKINKIIDIIRIHRKKSKKLKLKFKEKNDSEKLFICFNLWKKNVFDLDDDIDEDIFETFSSVNGNDYYNEKNRKIINSINSLNSINSSINSSNSINYKKPNKNTNSSNKKMINNKEKIEKQKKKDEKNNNISNKKTNKKSDEINTIENGKKINNKNKTEEIEVKKTKENNNIIIIDTNVDKYEKKYNNKNDRGRVEYNEEEYEDEEEEEEEDDIEENNDNNKLNGNNYTRISDIDNNRIKYGNKNIKNKKDENNQKEKNISNKNNKNKIKDKLINLFEMIDDKKKLYFYFIKWHNNILFKKNSDEKNDENEDTIIVTPRKIITKIIKNFSLEDDDVDKRKEKGNTIRESLSFFNKKNKKRILMKNEINDFKKRSKTLLTHQKKGSFIINRSENYYNDFEDDDNYSERIHFNKSIKLLSSLNNSSSKNKILRKKNKNNDNITESNNNIAIEKEYRNNIVKENIGNTIVKSKKIDGELGNKANNNKLGNKNNNNLIIKKLNIPKLQTAEINTQKKDKKEKKEKKTKIN